MREEILLEDSRLTFLDFLFFASFTFYFYSSFTVLKPL